MQGYVQYGKPDCQNLHGHFGGGIAMGKPNSVTLIDKVTLLS